MELFFFWTADFGHTQPIPAIFGYLLVVKVKKCILLLFPIVDLLG